MANVITLKDMIDETRRRYGPWPSFPRPDDIRRWSQGDLARAMADALEWSVRAAAYVQNTGRAVEGRDGLEDDREALLKDLPR